MMAENNKNIEGLVVDADSIKEFDLPDPVTVELDKDGNKIIKPLKNEKLADAMGLELDPDADVGDVQETAIEQEVVEDVQEIVEDEVVEPAPVVKDEVVEPAPEPIQETVEETPVVEKAEEPKTIEATDDEINTILGLDETEKLERKEGTRNIDDLVGINLEEEINMVRDEINQYQTEKIKRVPKKINLSDLSIVERNAIQQNNDLKSALYTGKASFTIAATKSGYSASMLPLVHKDAQRILYSSLDPVSQQKETYKIIHEKMYDIGVDRMKKDFNYWLKNTAAEDIDTFYYGVYCSTFPDGGTLEVQCDECGHSTGYTIPHDNLITTEDPNTRALSNDIIREVVDEDTMKKYSLINKNETYLLEDSGMIIEVKTPTLYDLLDIMRNVREEKIKRDPNSVTNMLYVERILLPNKSIEGQYSQVTDRRRILHIIDNLSLDDAELVNTIIGELIEIHRLTFSVKSLVCESCGASMNDLDFNIEDVLFTAIFDRYQ
jgi:hypothetical protein